MALLHSAAARLLPYGGVRQRQGFGIGPSFGPSSTGGSRTYVDPTAGFREVGTLGKYGGYRFLMNTRTPNFLNVTTIILPAAIRACHTLTVAVSSKWKNIGGFLRPGTKYTRNFGQEVFGTYRDGPIESFDDIKSIKVVYDEYLDDVANMDFFYSISERYLFPSEDDFTGTIGDENEWIFEKFTDRRLRWVYIFTDEDYDRAKAMYDERMANFGNGEK